MKNSQIRYTQHEKQALMMPLSTSRHDHIVVLVRRCSTGFKRYSLRLTSDEHNM